MLTKLVVVLSLGAASALKLPAPSQKAQLDRRSFAASALLGAVALAPLEAQASSTPIWGTRKGTIEKPWSVAKGCKVDKACGKGATFGGIWADIGAKPPAK